MSFRRYLFLVFLTSPLFSIAQELRQLNSSEIKLGLQKLNVVGSVLYIAAHPDDENTRLLSYLAKEKKVRTGYLSLTRGDGGQNLIGTEQSELLGVIRTQELLAARKVDGAEQFFTRANDFGFSKTSEESLNFWGKDQVLADMVWVIRNFKPDVIITRFPEDARAGHGQHAASAILAREAFFAAADANRYPEQLQYVKPWSTTRILWNTFNFNSANNTTSDDQLKINVGLYNPLLGKSYGELAAESRSNHKSQGFGSANQRGDIIEYFKHIAGSEAKADLFEGIDLTWNRVGSGKTISELAAQAEKNFDASNPWKSVVPLLKIKTLIEKTDNKQKLAEIDALIVACSGLWFEMNTLEPIYAVSDSIPVRLQAILRVPKDFPHRVSISEPFSKQKNISLEPNKFVNISSTIKLPEAVISQPYWLKTSHSPGSYTINGLEDVGKPENKDRSSITFTISVGDQRIQSKQPLVYKFTDQVRGEVYQHTSFAPPVTATLSDQAFIFGSSSPRKVLVKLQSFRDNVTGTLRPKIPAGWKITPSSVEFKLIKKSDIQTQEFTISPEGKPNRGNLLLEVLVAGKTYHQGIKELKYDHIPAQILFPKAEAELIKIDLKTSGKNIGYIAGAGDLVAESLKQIGYTVTSLSDEQVIKTDLSAFDAIITGVRLYNTNAQVKLMQPRLMDYVSKGGVLLVQYNVSNPLLISNLGPYPFRLNRDRVTEEDAQVRIIDSQHPVLNYPNKITAADFENWIQERGLYFTTEADKAYTPVISINDKGEKENSGSILTANYGKGKFVYTSLSFFRQLPAGVPGAYRLFINLISK